MIERIKGKGFLGPNIDQECGNKMIFIGPNRSGKTTRTNAIHLALNGFVSTAHKVCKKPADILEQYSGGNSLTSTIIVGGREFEFHIFKKESVTVSKRFRVDHAKYSEKEYMEELVKAGNPKIIDLSSFILMSDAKKIDYLFKLFPADIDITKLNKNIAKKTAEKKKFTADLKTKKAVIKENTKAKNEIELPTGTLAEIRKEIENYTTAYLVTRDKIAGLKAELKKETKPCIVETDISQEKVVFTNDEFEAAKNEAMHTGDFGSFKDAMEENDPVKIKTTKAMRELNKHTIQSLQRVLDVMIDSGCQLCTASMVCKQEIKKYERND